MAQGGMDISLGEIICRFYTVDDFSTAFLRLILRDLVEQQFLGLTIAYHQLFLRKSSFPKSLNRDQIYIPFHPDTLDIQGVWWERTWRLLFSRLRFVTLSWEQK